MQTKAGSYLLDNKVDILAMLSAHETMQKNQTEIKKVKNWYHLPDFMRGQYTPESWAQHRKALSSC